MPGEFTRLFQALPSISQSQNRKTRAGRSRAATRAGAIVLLKGPDTKVVAAPDGRAAIADNVPPWLASCGLGRRPCRSGVAGGLLAQGMPGLEATAAAVWLHGEAGSDAGPGLISKDLPEMLPKLYRRLFAEHAP